MSRQEADDPIDLPALLAQARAAWMNELHTAFPAEIVSYDAASQTARVRPMVRRALPDIEGGRAVEDLAEIAAVPVCWPRAGNWAIHMPLAAGDFVLVVCCERDFTRWRRTGRVGDPVGDQTQHLSHAIAIPGVYPRTKQLSDVPSDALVIGKQGGATIRIKDNGEVLIGGVGAVNLVALANLVKAELDKIAITLASGTVTVGAPGPTAVVFGTPYVSTAVAASKTRAL